MNPSNNHVKIEIIQNLMNVLTSSTKSQHEIHFHLLHTCIMSVKACLNIFTYTCTYFKVCQFVMPIFDQLKINMIMTVCSFQWSQD